MKVKEDEWSTCREGKDNVYFFFSSFFLARIIKEGREEGSFRRHKAKKK
jgi:hypothetical protein